jgi:hypothetical protein
MLTRLWVFAAACSLAAPLCAVRAEDDLPGDAPGVVAHWVGASGDFKSQFKDVKTRWIWHGALTGMPEGTPVLRIDLKARIPENWGFLRSSSEHAQLVALDAADSSDPAFRHIAINQVGSNFRRAAARKNSR